MPRVETPIIVGIGAGPTAPVSITFVSSGMAGSALSPVDTGIYSFPSQVGIGIAGDANAALTITPGGSASLIRHATLATFNVSAGGALAAAGSGVFGGPVVCGGAAVNGYPLQVVGSGLGRFTDGTRILDLGVVAGGALVLTQTNISLGFGTNTRATDLVITAAGLISVNATISSYNAVVTAGLGVPAIYGQGRVVAKTNVTSGTIATYTIGAADGSFMVAANVLVTAATACTFTVTVSYTDEGNTARTLTLTFSQITGTFLTAITNVTGIGAYEGVPLYIRAKASTAITIQTAAGGTYTGVTYNADACITQMA